MPKVSLKQAVFDGAKVTAAASAAKYAVDFLNEGNYPMALLCFGLAIFFAAWAWYQHAKYTFKSMGM